MFARQRGACRWSAACPRHRLRRQESAPAHRAAGPPFRLPHPRKLQQCGAQNPVASASRARVCFASAILRRNRMIPAGRTSFSHARSSAVSSVPPSPTTSRLPAACRKLSFRFQLTAPCLLIPNPSCLFPSAPVATLPADSAPAAASANSHPSPRSGPQSSARAA